MGLLIGIYTAFNKGAPMEPHQSIDVMRGHGLANDRYALQRGSWKARGEVRHKPKHQVTLIAIEDIVAANQDRPFELQFSPNETRRNLVTEGIELRTLIGKEIVIGHSVRLRAIEEAAPCERPSTLCGKLGFAEAIKFGGLNCEILEGGPIALSDEISCTEKL